MSDQLRDEARDHLVDAVLLQTAFSTERKLSLAKTLILVIFLVRYATVSPTVLQSWVTLPAVLISLFYTLVFLSIPRLSVGSPKWLWGSVTMDSVVTAIALSSNIIDPGADYRGLLSMPDTMIFLVVVFASGFRLSYKITLFSGVLSFILMTFLIFLEATLNSERLTYGASSISMWVVVFIATLLVSVILAYQTRTLIQEGVIKTQLLEQGKTLLEILARSHHDANSLLSSLKIYSESLVHSLEETRSPDLKLARTLDLELDRICEVVNEIKSSAISIKEKDRLFEYLDIKQFLEVFVTNLKAVSNSFSVKFKSDLSKALVRVAGGETAFTRVVVNLVKNASEGNGQHGAKNLLVELKKSRKEYTLTFSDDGPGFLFPPNEIKKTTKMEGSALGLDSVERIIHACGGSVQYGESCWRGAKITLILPILTEV